MQWGEGGGISSKSDPAKFTGTFMICSQQFKHNSKTKFQLPQLQCDILLQCKR